MSFFQNLRTSGFGRGAERMSDRYMCGKPAACWAKRVLIDCDDDPGLTVYEALCREHVQDAGHGLVLSEEEMGLIEVHES